MKKILSTLLCAAMLLGLTACGPKPAEPAVSVVPETGTQETIVEGQNESSAPAGEDAGSADRETGAEDGFINADDEPDEPQSFADYEEDKYHTTKVPEGQQKPVEPGTVEIDTNSEKTCYLSIYCSTILDNMDELTAGKEGLVPGNGVILGKTKVVFYEGESVFDVLRRETRNRKIHMESSFTPMYNSAYIEGIHNLYEFDCGAESGWMYRVNGWFPNYGVSRYQVKEGDDIQFHYTCDLGRDVGDQYWENMR